MHQACHIVGLTLTLAIGAMQIMDDKNVPKAVLSERPASKHRDLYTIRFFPAAD